MNSRVLFCIASLYRVVEKATNFFFSQFLISIFFTIYIFCTKSMFKFFICFLVLLWGILQAFIGLMMDLAWLGLWIRGNLLIFEKKTLANHCWCILFCLQVQKQACDKYDPTFYPKFKKWCDDYFLIKVSSLPFFDIILVSLLLM